MDKSDAIDLIKKTIFEIYDDGVNFDITDKMPLIGSESNLDSMKLVELCLALEDKANELGFDFDWTSDNAMSRSTSIFRSLSSLATEFKNQKSKIK